MNIRKFADFVEGMVRELYAKNGEWVPMALVQLPTKDGSLEYERVFLSEKASDADESHRLQALCLDLSALKCATVYEAILTGSAAEQREIEKGNVALDAASPVHRGRFGIIPERVPAGLPERVLQFFICTETGKTDVRQIPVVDGRLGRTQHLTGFLESPYLEIFGSAFSPTAPGRR